MVKNSIKINGFCCKNALKDKLSKELCSNYEPEIFISTLPCSSKVETLAIIKAFESGADGVFVMGCAEGLCQLIDGNARAKRIVNHTKKLLVEIGINPDCLEMIVPGPDDNFDIVAKNITKKISALKK